MIADGVVKAISKWHCEMHALITNLIYLIHSSKWFVSIKLSKLAELFVMSLYEKATVLKTLIVSTL